MEMLMQFIIYGIHVFILGFWGGKKTCKRSVRTSSTQWFSGGKKWPRYGGQKIPWMFTAFLGQVSLIPRIEVVLWEDSRTAQFLEHQRAQEDAMGVLPCFFQGPLCLCVITLPWHYQPTRSDVNVKVCLVSSSLDMAHWITFVFEKPHQASLSLF